MSNRTYWLSKHALSTGITAVESSDEPSDKYIRPNGYWTSFRVDTEIHLSEYAAKQAAEAMRVKKIASLKKQIAKLEAMKF